MTELPAAGGAARARRAGRTRHRRHAGPTAVRLGIAIAFCCVTLLPFGIVIVDAFNSNATLETTTIGSLSGLTLANFRFIFTSTPMLTFLWNSILACTAATLMTVILGGLAGYAMSRYRVGWLSGYSVGLFFIQVFPIILILIPLVTILKDFGLINTLTSVVLVYATQALPFACWMFRAYFDTLPLEMEEAAWVDGASRFHSFVRIVCPNSWPAAVSVAIFTFLLAWGDYLIALILLTSQNVLTLPVGMERFVEQHQTEWGPIFASSAVMMVPPVVVFAVLQRYYNLKGISSVVGH